MLCVKCDVPGCGAKWPLINSDITPALACELGVTEAEILRALNKSPMHLGWAQYPIDGETYHACTTCVARLSLLDAEDVLAKEYARHG